jgi:serine/threonine protein kinase
VLLESILITEAVDAPQLDQFLADQASSENSHSHSALRQIVSRLGLMLRQLHASGLAHRDLKAANLLIHQGEDPAGQIVLIDLDGLSKPPRITLRQRMQGLMRLTVTLMQCPGVNAPARLRMGLAYAQRFGAPRPDFKRLWRTLDRQTARKIRHQQTSQQRKARRRSAT